MSRYDMPEGFEDIPFFLQKYLVVRPWCRTVSEAAEKSDINRRTVQLWRQKSPVFAECEKYFMEVVISDCKERFGSLTPEAVDVYERAMQGEDMRTGLSAARDILKEQRIISPEIPQQVVGRILVLPFERRTIESSRDDRVIEGVCTPLGSEPISRQQEEDKGSELGEKSG